MSIIRRVTTPRWLARSRGLCDFVLPAHLRQSFVTPTTGSRCMLIGSPFWRYPIATVPPHPQVAELIHALREAEKRPFRIVSHEAQDGKVFNVSFFDNEETMRQFLSWYTENALEPGSKYHHCLQPAAEGDILPTDQTLVFGTGNRLLADTRFGEYQLGMAVRYTRQVLRSAEALAEATAEGGISSAEMEERIAARMQAEGVSYFGRLIMEEDAPGEILTAVRFGSVEDAHRGARAMRDEFATELARWFASHTSLIGTATRVLEL